MNKHHMGCEAQLAWKGLWTPPTRHFACCILYLRSLKEQTYSYSAVSAVITLFLLYIVW